MYTFQDLVTLLNIPFFFPFNFPYYIGIQGRLQDLVGVGGKEMFFSDLGICMTRSNMLRMASQGFGGMLPRGIFLKRCNIWCVLGCILIRFCLYFISKITIFYIRNKYFRYTYACYGVFLMNTFLKTCYD